MIYFNYGRGYGIVEFWIICNFSSSLSLNLISYYKTAYGFFYNIIDVKYN